MSWFPEWVDIYCQATAADDRTAAALKANESVFVGEWAATLEELGECASRLVRDRRVPKFANEHSDALGNELHHLRVERTTDTRPDSATEDFEECDACGGSGLVVVPVRACVWQRRLVLHKQFKRVITGAVLCDRSGCNAGKRSRDAEPRIRGDKPHRPTLTQAERVCGCDLVAMMQDYDREMGRRARQVEPHDSHLANLVASLVSKARRTA